MSIKWAGAALAVLVMMLVPSHNTREGFWKNADEYVYYTEEAAIYTGEVGGVAEFETADGNIWGAYIYDSDLLEGERCVLTFENIETRREYMRAEFYGIKTVTREDARVISID